MEISKYIFYSSLLGYISVLVVNVYIHIHVYRGSPWNVEMRALGSDYNARSKVNYIEANASKRPRFR